MRNHLKTKHAILYHQHEQQQERSRRPSPSPTRESGAEASNKKQEEDDVNEPPAKKQKLMIQPSVKKSITELTKYHADHPRKQRLDNLICEMVCLDMQPFTIVEDRGFRNLCKEFDPRYPMLGRRQLTRNCLPKLYQKHFGVVKNELDKAEFIALTTDDWTSRAGRGYMSFTAHFVDDSWKLQSKVIACSRIKQSQTGEYIVQEVEEFMTKWQIKQKVVAIVTDETKNMMKAGRLLDDIEHVYCFAHNLNLVVKDTLGALSTLEKARAKVRKIVSHFHHTHKATRQLEDYQTQEIEEKKKEKAKQREAETTNGNIEKEPEAKDKASFQRPKKLIQEVATRWNSTYEMLQRFLNLQSHVRRVLTDNWKTELLLSKFEIETIEDAVAALKCFYDATTEMSSEKTTSMAKVVPVVNGLKYTLEDYANENKSAVAKELLKNLEKRFSAVENETVTTSAALLDPRFMNLAFSNEEKANKAIEDIKSQLPKTKPKEPEQAKEPKKERSGYWAHFDQKVKKTKESVTKSQATPSVEMETYLQESPLDREMDPLEWWSVKAMMLPNLGRLAKKFASIPATSTPSERLFSKAGELVSQRRANISDSHIDSVLFLNKNM